MPRPRLIPYIADSSPRSSLPAADQDRIRALARRGEKLATIRTITGRSINAIRTVLDGHPPFRKDVATPTDAPGVYRPHATPLLAVRARRIASAARQLSHHAN